MTDAQVLLTKARRLAELRARAVAAVGGPADLATSFDPKFRTPPHIRILSDAIVQAVENGRTGDGPSRLIVSMPPRAGKSFTTSLWTPAWFLARFPDRHVILASHESNFAISWGRKTRNLYRDLGKRGLATSGLSQAVSAAGEWETVAGGGMLSRGIGSAITGRGAHLALIDDPIKDFVQAQSAHVRQQQWEWWLSTMQTRLEPGAAVVVTMTRWHEDDLAGRLLSERFEGDPSLWRSLAIPAVSEDGYPDALGRADGTALTLASLDETEQDAQQRWDTVRREVGPYVWQALYQQRPSEPEGALLKRGWWQHYRRDGDTLVLPDGRHVDIQRLQPVQSWDLAFKDTDDSDYVVGQVWAAHGPDRFLLDQWRGRTDMPGTVQQIKTMLDRWPTTTQTWIEDAANGPAVIQTLRRSVSGVVPRKPRGSKQSRVFAVQGQVESGHVWLPDPVQAPWVGPLVDELAAFPTGSHDDQVDALTQALLGLVDVAGSSVGVARGVVGRGSQGRVVQSRTRVSR